MKNNWQRVKQDDVINDFISGNWYKSELSQTIKNELGKEIMKQLEGLRL